jgi:hypothetical protein
MKKVHKSTNVEFVLKYSNRKTYEIKIDPTGKVILKAPQKAKEKDILKIVQSKEKWIKDKLRLLKKMEEAKKEYIDGEIFLYLGKGYPLQLIIDHDIKKPIVKLAEDKLMIVISSKDPEVIKGAMEEWYRVKAIEKIKDRINYFQKYFQVKPNAIRIKNQKTRWGSCSSKRNLNFNFRCIMAPEGIIDYLVVHEMCHLVHMNHSKLFWNLVEEILPNYKERRMWLKNNEMKMRL